MPPSERVFGGESASQRVPPRFSESSRSEQKSGWEKMSVEMKPTIFLHRLSFFIRNALPFPANRPCGEALTAETADRSANDPTVGNRPLAKRIRESNTTRQEILAMSPRVVHISSVRIVDPAISERTLARADVRTRACTIPT